MQSIERETAVLATRTNDPDGTRRKILEAAFEAFAQQGYNATPMHRLREDAGVSGGAFSHHFPTKKSLGIAVIHSGVTDAIEQSWIRPVVEAPDTITGIDNAVDLIVGEIDGKDVTTGCPLGNLAAELSILDVDFRAALQPVYDTWREAILTKLKSETTGKTVHKSDLEAMATTIVATISGAIAMAKVSQSAEPLRQSWSEVRKLMMFLLTPQAMKNAVSRSA